MSFDLTDIEGAVVDKKSIGMPWGIANNMAGHGYIKGYEEGRDAQSKVCLQFSRDKLYEAISKYFRWSSGYPHLHCDKEVTLDTILDAIISKDKEIIELANEGDK